MKTRWINFMVAIWIALSWNVVFAISPQERHQQAIQDFHQAQREKGETYKNFLVLDKKLKKAERKKGKSSEEKQKLKQEKLRQEWLEARQKVDQSYKKSRKAEIEVGKTYLSQKK